MFKVIGLIVVGVFLMSFGVYSLMNANWPVLQLPNVNWGLVGFVTLVGGITVFGTAFAASRLSR
jgi:hypothetical protein